MKVDRRSFLIAGTSVSSAALAATTASQADDAAPLYSLKMLP